MPKAACPPMKKMQKSMRDMGKGKMPPKGKMPHKAK